MNLLTEHEPFLENMATDWLAMAQAVEASDPTKWSQGQPLGTSVRADKLQQRGNGDWGSPDGSRGPLPNTSSAVSAPHLQQMDGEQPISSRNRVIYQKRDSGFSQKTMLSQLKKIEESSKIQLLNK